MNKKTYALLIFGTVVLAGFLLITVNDGLRLSSNSPPNEDRRLNAAPVGGSLSPSSATLPSKTGSGDLSRGSSSDSPNVGPVTKGPEASLTRSGQPRSKSDFAPLSQQPPARSALRSPIPGVLNPSGGASLRPTATERVAKQYERFSELAQLDSYTRDQLITSIVNHNKLIGGAGGMIDEHIRQNMSQDEENQAFVKERLDWDKSLVEILGPDRFANFDAFRRTIPYRPLAEAIAVLCIDSNVEMSPDTVDALATALSKSSRPPLLLVSGTTRTQREYDESMQNAVDAARRVLTPAQLEIFQHTLAARAKPPLSH